MRQTFKNWQKRSVTGGKVCVTRRYRQWTHVFKILREIDLLYEYYGHFHHVIDKTKNIGGTVPV